MKIVESADFEKSLDLVESLMMPYYDEYGLRWDRDERRKLYTNSEHKHVLINEKFAGVLVFSFDGDLLRIFEIELDQEFQGAGIGTALVEELNAIGLNAGAKLMRLNVFKSNPALKFYLNNWFSILREGNAVYFLERAIT